MRKGIIFLLFFLLFLAWPNPKSIFAVAPAGTQFFEAESMTNDGTNWFSEDTRNKTAFEMSHSLPLGLGQMRGYSGQQGTASKDITLGESGIHRVWVRYIDNTYYHGPFRVKIVQDGQTIGEKVFDKAAIAGRPAGYSVFVWDYLDVDLTSGSIQLVLTKEKVSEGASDYGTSGVARILDCFVISDNLSYQPKAHDFVEPVYMKVGMGPTQSTPAAIHFFGQTVKDEETTSFYMMGHTNFTKTEVCFPTAYGCLDAAHRMSAGDSSPWFKISDYMGFNGDSMFQFFATTNYTDKLANSDYSVYFSTTPSDDGIFKTSHRSGNGAGMYLDANMIFKERTKSDYDFSTEARAVADNLQIHGDRAKKFPLATSLSIDIDKMTSDTIRDNELDILSKLGFNSLPQYSQDVLDRGFVKPHSESILQGDLCAPQETLMHSRLDPIISNVLAGKVQDKLSYFKLLEEPSGPSFNDIIGKSICSSNFVDYLKNKGLSPSDLGKSSWSEVVPSKDKQNEPKLYYRTVLFRNQKLVDFTKVGNDIVQKSLPGAKTIGNFSPLMSYNGNPLSTGFDMFQMHKQGALTYGWTEDWDNSGLSRQVNGYDADFLRAASNGQFGLYDIVSGRKPQDAAAKSANLIGHGATTLDFSTYGPVYVYGLGISNSYDLFPAISAVNYAIGSMEDYILGATVPKSKIALLYTPTTDIWRLQTGTTGGLWEEVVNIFGKERMHLYLLLRHLGYPIDILTEDDVINGKLAGYQMLVVEGSHLKQGTVSPLVSWVQAGGRLYLGAGSGMYNENNQPLSLDSQLGIGRKNFYYVNIPVAYDNSLIYQKNLDTVSFKGNNLESISATQKVSSIPSGAEISATFSDGSPAFLNWTLGSGKIIYSGFFPGLAYAKSGAQSKKTADAAGERSTYNPPSYSGKYRDLFQGIVQNLSYKPMVETDNYLVEANVLESSKGLLVTLSNWGEGDVKDLHVKIRTANLYKQPSAAEKNIKSFQQTGNEINMTLDVDDFEMIKLPLESVALTADLNSDKAVNALDLDILKSDFLKFVASLLNPKSDINADGQATVKDVGILMSGWKL